MVYQKNFIVAMITGLTVNFYKQKGLSTYV